MIHRSSVLAAAVAGASLVALSIATAAPAVAATNRQVHMAGNLSAAGRGSSPVSYDPALAPLGAHVSVAVVETGERTQVALDVTRLLPDHGYVAHAHVNPCGATAADAGGHFQNTVDPAAGPDRPSTDPAYANAENEVWLDLQTDGSGAAHAETDVPFTFATRAPRSVVIHAGMNAATRVACITL